MYILNAVIRLRQLFSLIEIIFWFIFFVILNFAYQYMISKNILSSIILGIFGGSILFYAIALLNRRSRVNRATVLELNKYASTIVFKLKSNLNVVEALQSVQSVVNDQLQKDVQTTLIYLQENQEIQTDHFLKYQFAAINIFHQILRIKYQYGGRASELFHQILQDLTFEINIRDQLFRKKRIIALQTYVMIIMAGVIPVMLRILASDVYRSFLTMLLSQMTTFLFHIVLLFNILLLQKAKTDISLRNI